MWRRLLIVKRGKVRTTLVIHPVLKRICYKRHEKFIANDFWMSTIKQRGHVRFLDARWVRFLSRCNFDHWYWLLPWGRLCDDSISEHVVGSLLVGGGNLSYGYHKSISDVKSIMFDKDREILETEIIEESMNMDKPVLGVCRGMQSIGCFFGARLRRVNSHVGGRHSIEFMETSDPTLRDRDSVNSYHQFGFLQELPQSLSIFAKTGDVVEGFASRLSDKGFVWHRKGRTA